jgi:hypothetical protein
MGFADFKRRWFGRMTLYPVSGQIVHTTLSMIERELFEADWADAKQRLGRDLLITDLSRTPAQRRADALVEMATRPRPTRPLTGAARSEELDGPEVHHVTPALTSRIG